MKKKEFTNTENSFDLKKQTLIFIKNGLQWLLALLFGFLIVNFFCFFFERPVGWYDTNKGASRAIRRPGALLVHGSEGYAITKIDRYGYTNEDKPLADSYILVMGSSHTQGKEVDSNNRFTTIVDREIYNDDNYLHVFNIGADANFFPTQIKHFDAAINAYPNSSLVVLEVSRTDYSISEIKDACNQVVYNPSDSVDAFDEMNMKNRVIINIKEFFPLLSRIKTQIEASEEKKLKENVENTNIDEYQDAMNEALSLIRSEYNGPIVILYHPETKLSADGSLELVYSSTWNTFKATCIDNDIDIIDLGPLFEEEYYSSYELPYGFINTTPGSGHLNKVGHKIAAEGIIHYLEEQE